MDRKLIWDALLMATPESLDDVLGVIQDYRFAHRKLMQLTGSNASDERGAGESSAPESTVGAWVM